MTHEGPLGQSVGETRWMEMWGVLYTRRLCFYMKRSKREDSHIELLDVIEVAKVTEKHFPGAFLKLSTVGE